MQTKKLRNAPDSVPVWDRPEQFLFKKDGEVEGLPLRAGWTEAPALAGEGSQVFGTAFFTPDPGETHAEDTAVQVSPDHLVGNRPPIAVAFREAILVDPSKVFELR